MLVTKQDVFNAADAIAASGKNPTMNEVRHVIGSGSFTLISSAMSEWRSLQCLKNTVISASNGDFAPESILSRLNEIVNDVWFVACQQANQRVQQDSESLEQAKQAFEITKLETAELADAVHADFEKAQNLIAQQQAEAAASAVAIESLTKTASILNESLIEARHEAQTAKAVLTEVQQRVAQLIEMLESEKAERIHAGKKFEQSLITIAELNANVAELDANLNAATSRAITAEAKANQTDIALADASKKLDKSVNEVRVWQNKAAIAETQVSSLKEQIGELKSEGKNNN